MEMLVTLAIFIHGFSDTEACWEPLLTLMATDLRIQSRFKCETFSYSTAKFDLNPLSRLPALLEVASKLADRIARRLSPENPERFTDVVLVGHSMGGLIIQEYLVMKLLAGQGTDLSAIRQAILIATPNRGSITFAVARNLLSRVISNPQEECLQVFNPEIDRVTRTIEESVIDATSRGDHEYPVPIHAFWGSEDNVVPQPSAMGSFEVATQLDGDHRTVLQPASLDDENYQKIANALLHPAGHKHIFELDSYETRVTVSPLTGAAQQFRADVGSTTRTGVSDNYGKLARAVAFSQENICKDRFRFNYRTQPVGLLLQDMEFLPANAWEFTPRNEAAKDEIGRYIRSGGTEVTFEFTPRAARTYIQNLQVWKGFDQGRRDVHFHHRNLRCKLYRFIVDLSAYVTAGWTVTRPPNLFIFWEDTECDGLCQQRVHANPLTPSHIDPAGKWIWELEDFRGGVVDAIWDVDSAPPPPL